MKIKQAFQIKPWLDVNKDTVNQHQMTHSSLTFTLRTSQMDASKSWELPPSTGPHWAGPHLKKGCYTTSLASVSQARPQSLTAPCQGPIYLSTIIPTHWKKKKHNNNPSAHKTRSTELNRYCCPHIHINGAWRSCCNTSSNWTPSNLPTGQRRAQWMLLCTSSPSI